ncbi:Serine/threonine-protein kinase KIN2 [Balamuthia mandrillaris]
MQRQQRRIQCIGHYDLDKTIGQGQFGKVKLATHVLTGEKVAVKIILKSKLDPETLKKVYREVRIMKLLNHPNIIRLYEVIETDKVLFLVMEYASGGEVLDFIVAHGRLGEREARKFFRHIVSAIDYCHKHRVIHRDLKCENLLLDGDLNIKIIDFGLSNCFTPGSLMKTFCGSPTYCAPELIQRKEYKGPEIDVWSLGVVLFVLVCGYLPFDAKDFQSLFRKILSGNYTIPNFVSNECRSLIKAMLVGDPERRATLEQVMSHEWMQGPPPWQPHTPETACAPPVCTTVEEIDGELIKHLERLGFEREGAIDSVLKNNYDVAASTYYLLASRKLKSQLAAQRAQAQGVDEMDADWDDMEIEHTRLRPSHQRGRAPMLTITSANSTPGMEPPQQQTPSSRGGRGHRRHHTVDTPILLSREEEQEQSQQQYHQQQASPPSSDRTSAPHRSQLPASSSSSHFSPSPSAQVITRETQHNSAILDRNHLNPHRSNSSTPQPPTPTITTTIAANNNRTHYEGMPVVENSSNEPTSSQTEEGNRALLPFRRQHGGGHRRARSVDTKMEGSDRIMHGAEGGGAASPYPQHHYGTPSHEEGLPLSATGSSATSLIPDKASSKGPSKSRRPKSIGSWRSTNSDDTLRPEGGKEKEKIGEEDSSPLASPYLEDAMALESHPDKAKARLRSRKGKSKKSPRNSSNNSSRNGNSKARKGAQPVVTEGPPLSPLSIQGSVDGSSNPTPALTGASGKAGHGHRRSQSLGHQKVLEEMQQQQQQQQQQYQGRPLAASRDTCSVRHPQRPVHSGSSTDRHHSSLNSFMASVRTGFGFLRHSGNAANINPTASSSTASNSTSASRSPTHQHHRHHSSGQQLQPQQRLTHYSPPQHLLAQRQHQHQQQQHHSPPERRFALNLSTTSHKAADDILKEVVRVLSMHGIPHVCRDFCIDCKYEDVCFEVEVCKVPLLPVNAVRFNRIAGDAWAYKSIAAQLVEEMEL